MYVTFLTLRSLSNLKIVELLKELANKEPLEQAGFILATHPQFPLPRNSYP